MAEIRKGKIEPVESTDLEEITEMCNYSFNPLVESIVVGSYSNSNTVPSFRFVVEDDDLYIKGTSHNESVLEPVCIDTLSDVLIQMSAYGKPIDHDEYILDIVNTIVDRLVDRLYNNGKYAIKNGSSRTHWGYGVVEVDDEVVGTFDRVTITCEETRYYIEVENMSIHEDAYENYDVVTSINGNAEYKFSDINIGNAEVNIKMVSELSKLIQFNQVDTKLIYLPLNGSLYFTSRDNKSKTNPDKDTLKEVLNTGELGDRFGEIFLDKMLNENKEEQPIEPNIDDRFNNLF